MNHALDARFGSEVQDESALVVAAPQVVVQLPSSAGVEAIPRLDLDDEAPLDQQVDPEATHDGAVIPGFDEHLGLDLESELPELAPERLPVHGFEEAVTASIEGTIERADHCACELGIEPIRSCGDAIRGAPLVSAGIVSRARLSQATPSRLDGTNARIVSTPSRA